MLEGAGTAAEVVSGALRLGLGVGWAAGCWPGAGEAAAAGAPGEGERRSCCRDGGGWG